MNTLRMIEFNCPAGHAWDVALVKDFTGGWYPDSPDHARCPECGQEGRPK